MGFDVRHPLVDDLEGERGVVERHRRTGIGEPGHVVAGVTVDVEHALAGRERLRPHFSTSVA
jgi:hypothetical protein